MASLQKRLGSFLIGLYVWVVVISFGMVVVDVLYARLVPEATFALSEVSDFLLMVSLVTLIAAVVTLTFSRQSKAAVNWIIASQLLFLLEFLLPALFSLINIGADGNSIGPWLRLISSGAASIAALIGLYRYNRQQ